MVARPFLAGQSLSSITCSQSPALAGTVKTFGREESMKNPERFCRGEAGPIKRQHTFEVDIVTLEDRETFKSVLVTEQCQCGFGTTRIHTFDYTLKSSAPWWLEDLLGE